MRNLSRVFSLSGSEMLFLAHCLAVVAAVRLGLTLLSYNKVRSMVTRLDASAPAGIGDLRRVAWGVAAAFNGDQNACICTLAAHPKLSLIHI